MNSFDTNYILTMIKILANMNKMQYHPDNAMLQLSSKFGARTKIKSLLSYHVNELIWH